MHIRDLIEYHLGEAEAPLFARWDFGEDFKTT